MSRLTLSKEYGVNPSVEMCHCCGKETEIVMFGSSYKDASGKTAEAPMRTSLGNICDNCKEVIEGGGIFFIECRDGESGDNPHRTGRIIAVKESAVKEMFNNYAKINYMEHHIFEHCFGHFMSANIP